MDKENLQGPVAKKRRFATAKKNEDILKAQNSGLLMLATMGNATRP